MCVPLQEALTVAPVDILLTHGDRERGDKTLKLRGFLASPHVYKKLPVPKTLHTTIILFYR